MGWETDNSGVIYAVDGGGDLSSLTDGGGSLADLSLQTYCTGLTAFTPECQAYLNSAVPPAVNNNTPPKKKPNYTWIWVLLALIILAAIVYFVWFR